MISGERLIAATASPPSRLRTAAVSIAVSGHSELTAMPSAGELRAHAQRAHRHAELRHRVGDVVLEPFGLHVERRRQIQDVRVGGLLQVRNARLGDQERAARVDLVHQVEALHVGLPACR